MYIPRPAKLLFQHDKGWDRFLEKNGHLLSAYSGEDERSFRLNVNALFPNAP
jgi:hypothetical protein